MESNNYNINQKSLKSLYRYDIENWYSYMKTILPQTTFKKFMKLTSTNTEKYMYYYCYYVSKFNLTGQEFSSKMQELSKILFNNNTIYSSDNVYTVQEIKKFLNENHENDYVVIKLLLLLSLFTFTTCSFFVNININNVSVDKNGNLEIRDKDKIFTIPKNKYNENECPVYYHNKYVKEIRPQYRLLFKGKYERYILKPDGSIPNNSFYCKYMMMKYLNILKPNVSHVPKNILQCSSIPWIINQRGININDEKFVFDNIIKNDEIGDGVVFLNDIKSARNDNLKMMNIENDQLLNEYINIDEMKDSILSIKNILNDEKKYDMPISNYLNSKDSFQMDTVENYNSFIQNHKVGSNNEYLEKYSINYIINDENIIDSININEIDFSKEIKNIESISGKKYRINKGKGRPRKWESNAEKSKQYRLKKKEKIENELMINSNQNQKNDFILSPIHDTIMDDKILSSFDTLFDDPIRIDTFFDDSMIFAKEEMNNKRIIF